MSRCWTSLHPSRVSMSAWVIQASGSTRLSRQVVALARMSMALLLLGLFRTQEGDLYRSGPVTHGSGHGLARYGSRVLFPVGCLVSPASSCGSRRWCVSWMGCFRLGLDCSERFGSVGRFARLSGFQERVAPRDGNLRRYSCVASDANAERPGANEDPRPHGRYGTRQSGIPVFRREADTSALAWCTRHRRRVDHPVSGRRESVSPSVGCPKPAAGIYTRL